MATELYLDTARLGRMCTEAHKAERDFAKLASQLGSSLYWERFLVSGFDALPASLRRRCAALECWWGLAGLRRGLADFVSLPPAGAMLLAGQSRTLITLAAESLFGRCRRVLATDLEWPPYLAVLKQAALRHGKSLHVLPLRGRVLTAGCDRSELIERIVSAYRSHDCDGLFLSDITHTGVRIPYQQVLRRMTPVERPRFVVIDGAQAFAQRPVSLSNGEVDLYLAGTQKWFGAYHPLRLAFVGPRVTGVEASMRRMLVRREMVDPLSSFCEATASGDWSPYGETVNLSALMTAAGALAGWKKSAAGIDARWRVRRINRRRILHAIAPTARPVIDESLSAGIALVQMDGIHASGLPSRASLREALARRGVVASEPLRGLIRLSMPAKVLSPGSLRRLQAAFCRVRRSLTRSASDHDQLIPLQQS
ncbi:MAG: aminotransferase class V-fold PLP-dependent enzyme, partial [Planctomycetaceae bacterium]|nr:aminotransferase class V-fold PLP-dependent enzyme [Planctomycetaceae bacterium]